MFSRLTVWIAALPTLVGSLSFVVPAVTAKGQDQAESVAFFAEEVYPILKEHCFKCHGEEEKLKGNFRVTSREGLMQGGDLGSGYYEANPAESELLKMISYQTDDQQMPPKAKLPDDQIAILTRWVVEHGAIYDPALEIAGSPSERKSGFSITEEQRNWWSYQPVRAIDPPTVPDPAWAKNGIDAFIRHSLDAAGLKPNPPAEPGVLCRRVFYDLTGLPPTLDEVTRFEAAWRVDSERAWSDLIEDLMARPQYGEKWARHWLDIVRYAESNGFERDNPKPWIWRYRDYVIDAFNNDKPYDQFVIEQLAGDEIDDPTRESLIATGFQRLMQWDDEPADRQQHVYDVLADNVAMTSEAFLGMTMGCSRCHDHKVDPISQKDYYSFMAFFHGVTHYETGGTLVSWASTDEKAKFEERRNRELAELRAKATALETEVGAFLKEANMIVKPGEAKPLTFVEDARSGGAEWEYTLSQPTPDWKEVGFRDKSWIKGQGGFGTKGTPGAEVRTEWKTSDIWMRTSFGLGSLPPSLALEIHHDEDVEVYLNGQLIHQAKGFLKDYQVIDLPKASLDALQTGRNVIAVHCRQSGGGQYVDLALRTSGGIRNDRASTVMEILNGKGGGKRTGEVAKHFGRDVVKEWKELEKKIADLGKQEPGDLINAVTERGPQPAPLAVHLRGSAHSLGDPVVPAFPAVLTGGIDPRPAEITPVEQDGRSTSGRRLALAKWIVSPDNPLTARVISNRVWQHHFGRGIAPSTNDLGGLGEKPTHPELLEWLAGELVRQGWSLKALHRQILTSQAYRLSSSPSDTNLAKDPENRLFWRFNMRRLTAEELRDSVLALSGNLNPRSGGNWVFPPVPAEVLATSSKPGNVWPVSANPEDHFRRSIYIHVKRSLRHPMMADFDQADTDSPCAVRFSTTVPTQALAMLNSDFINRQAGVLAEQLRRHSSKPEERVRFGLELVLQRVPKPDEVSHCLSFMDRIRREAGLDENAALERFALLALNLNEFVYLD